MQIVRWMTVGAAALALAGCGSKTETSSTETTATTTMTNSDGGMMMANGTDMAPAPAVSAGQTFANAAASSDAFEIASSQLAAGQAQSAAVKKFAASMIKAHTESTAKLKTAADAITPDPTLSAEQQQAFDSLKPLKGADFDKAYVAAQVDAHEKTLAALKVNSADTNVPASLRDFATKLSPTVAAHLNMAKGLKP